jgi:hypothetical protein
MKIMLVEDEALSAMLMKHTHDSSDARISMCLHAEKMLWRRTLPCNLI